MNTNQRRQRNHAALFKQAMASVSQQAANSAVAQLAARVPAPSGTKLRGTKAKAAQAASTAPGKTQMARHDAPLAHATALKTRGGIEVAPSSAGEVCFTRDVVVGNLVKTGPSGVDSPATLNGSSRVVFNPGNSVLFPWIDAASDLYQEYHLDTLGLEFIPGRNATTDGQVVMSSRINTQDVVPSSIVSLLQQDGAASNVFEGIGMRCQLRKRWQKCVRGNTNNILTEAGNEADSTEYLAGEAFFRSDAAVPPDTALGLIKLHYKIRFRYPKPSPVLSGAAQWDSGSGNADQTNSFGLTFTETVNTLAPMVSMSASGHVLTITGLPAGKFMIVVDWVPVSPTIGSSQYGNVTYAIGGTATAVTTFLPLARPFLTTSGAGGLMAMSTNISTPGTYTITLSGGFVPSSNTARCYCRITPSP